MIITDNKLFSDQDLRMMFREQLANAQIEVDKITKGLFQTNSDEQIVQHLYSKMEILPLEVHPESGEITEHQETKVQDVNVYHAAVFVKGVELEYSLSYSGKSKLWRFKPSTFTFNPPRGYVNPDRINDQTGIIKIKFGYPDYEFKPENVKVEIEKAIGDISEYLKWSKKDVLAHNQQIFSEIENLVSQRRDRLGGIQATIEALEIPIRRREGSPTTIKLPIKKKVISTLTPKGKSDPEYGISNQNYEQILNVIRHEGATFERTPSTFAVHNEEELRDILLAHLNGHFEGRAAGEVFRKNGKTDISIEFKNRAAFIAECKIWRGETALNDAVDQLLGYLTWRDVKTSIVIFNKENKDFSHIQDTIPEALSKHPKFIREKERSKHGEWKIIFKSKHDEQREVIVHVFVFDLYCQ